MTAAEATLRTGQIRARALGRRFELRSAEVRSLKEMLLRRRLPRTRELWAIRDIDLDIAPGEALGLIGENGSGKSTLLKLLAGIFAPSEGALAIGGRVGSMLELGAGFHPEFSGVENVYLNGAIHGLSRRYVSEHLDEILAFAELEDFAYMPVKTYSSGMYMRLGFAVAVHVNPDILLLDEVLAVGDAAFQQKCHGRIWEFKRAGGTIVFVSHDEATVTKLCDRAVLLDHGRVVEDGEPEDVIRTYHRLLTERRAPHVLGGTPPNAPCRFASLHALGDDGIERDRFVEGDPVTFEARVVSDEDVRSARFTIAIRDTGGQFVGSQTLAGVDVLSGHTASIRFHLPVLPLREGRFAVGVRLTSHDGDVELAVGEGLLEFAVFGDDSAAAGPVRLTGSWDVSDTAAAGEIAGRLGALR